MLPSGRLPVCCDCLLVNEVGLKQYLRVVRVLLPTVMMLPYESLQVFGVSSSDDGFGQGGGPDRQSSLIAARGQNCVFLTDSVAFSVNEVG